MARRRNIPQGLKKRVFNEMGRSCAYCGAYANSVDHVVPYVWEEEVDFDNLVPACMPCNSAASSTIFTTLGDKRDYILERRFGGNRQKSVSLWLKEDYDPLGYSLKSAMDIIIVVDDEEMLRSVAHQLTKMGVKYI